MAKTDRGIRFLPRLVRTWRGRLLGWYLGLLLVASLSSLLILRVVTDLQLDRRVDAELVQETEELRALSSGGNPDTGEPFAGDVAAIFDVFLSRNIPNEHETFVTLIDGEPFLRSAQPVPVRLDLQPDVVAAWASTTGSRRGEIQTDVGAVDYLAVELAGSPQKAVFVAVTFTDLMREEVQRPVLWASAVEATVGLVIAGLLAIVLTERMVRPVRDMTETVRSITAGDLTRRVPRGEDDELGRLAETFNDMLERLDEAFATQRRFLADAGHELRTPITVVRGHLELMGEDEADRRATMALVEEELSRMGRMVDELLTLARAERPDFLTRSYVDLDELTDRIFRKVAALGARDWRLDAVAVGICSVDAERLTQAMLALAENAVGHTVEGETISVGSRCTDDQVEFWVRDSGSGISAEQLDRIWNRFERGPGARHRPGSGLGLAIVRSIAEAHGGSVAAESQRGRGSTFTMQIPLASPERDMLAEVERS